MSECCLKQTLMKIVLYFFRIKYHKLFQNLVINYEKKNA